MAALVATGCGDNLIRLWTLEQEAHGRPGVCLRTLEHGGGGSGSALSPLCVRLVLGGGGLLSAGPDGVVKLWALRGEQLEGAEEVIAMSHGSNCRGLAASADGRLVASGGGRAVVVWRPA